MALPLSSLTATWTVHDMKARQLDVWKALNPATRFGVGIELERQFFASEAGDAALAIPWGAARVTLMEAIRGAAFTATHIGDIEYEFWRNA